VSSAHLIRHCPARARLGHENKETMCGNGHCRHKETQLTSLIIFAAGRKPGSPGEGAEIVARELVGAAVHVRACACTCVRACVRVCVRARAFWCVQVAWIRARRAEIQSKSRRFNGDCGDLVEIAELGGGGVHNPCDGRHWEPGIDPRIRSHLSALRSAQIF
jgi:hypothetical protein